MGTQEMTEETLDGSQDQDSENNNTHATDKDSQSQSLSPDAAQHGGNAPAKGSLCVPQVRIINTQQWFSAIFGDCSLLLS